MQDACDKKVRILEPVAAEWNAAYVKHQHERKVAQLLEQRGVEVFLPQREVTRRWKDRNKKLLIPLFPNYVFLRSNPLDKFQILNTHGVFFLVESGKRACPISEQEIDSIRRIAENGVPVHPHPFVSAGDRVRICSGPLAGISGMLTRFKNQYRVVITVELLQKAVSVEVELGNVRYERKHGSHAVDLKQTV